MSELNCKDCFVLGQQLEMAQQEIRALRESLKAIERDVNDAARDAAAKQHWRDTQGDDYGSY